MRADIWILTLLALVAVYAAQATESGPNVANQHESRSVRAGFKLPRLFDFDRFKTAFHKSYGSALEELVRMKLFLGRSYEVFISAVEYRLRRSSYYKAVNDKSDWSPAELGAIHNRLENKKERDSARDEDQMNLVEPTDLEAQLQKIEANANDPRFAPLAAELAKAKGRDPKQRASRRRRSAFEQMREDASSGEVRDKFVIGDALFRADRLVAQPTTRNQRKPASNNPSYQQPELLSMGAREYSAEKGYQILDELDVIRGTRRDFGHLPIKSNHKLRGRFLDKLTEAFLHNSWFGKQSTLPSDDTVQEESSEEADIVWVDHRQSGCFNPVQNQRNCAGCYAFSSIAFFEWAHCNQTGELVKFSEQYMIDCGRMTSKWLDGCQGGALISAGEFVSNFGLELAGHYPYMGAEGACPYHPQTERESMGYIRTAGLANVVKVGLEYAEEYLKKSPMLVYMFYGGNLEFYGGGVYDGKDCEDGDGSHGVVMIGHGREDGEEYWLIRNSYGASWGEQGYLKLNKNSNCIHPRHGFIFRSSREWDIRLDVQKNDRQQRADG